MGRAMRAAASRRSSSAWSGPRTDAGAWASLSEARASRTATALLSPVGDPPAPAPRPSRERGLGSTDGGDGGLAAALRSESRRRWLRGGLEARPPCKAHSLGSWPVRRVLHSLHRLRDGQLSRLHPAQHHWACPRSASSAF